MLLERDQHLDQLSACLQRSSAGEGRVVLVCGEAGIGKTSLLRAFAEQHEGSARVLWGGCEPLFTPRPLGPVFDLARQSLPALREALATGAGREVVFAAVLEELMEPGTVLVLEDAHWADEATLDLLKYVGRRLSTAPSLLVVTYRDDEVTAEHPLRFVLGDLPAASVTRLPLAALSGEAVATLAAREGIPAERLFSLTAGNPFFVTEVLATGDQAVPETVRDAVLARVARRSPAARELLEQASVIPSRAELSLMEALGQSASGVIDECVGTGVVRLDRDALVFRHELARRALESSLPGGKRRDLHARVLAALAGQEDVSGARLVHHAEESGNRAQVVALAPGAAEHAASLGAHREAASLLHTALRHADGSEPEQRARLHERFAYECYLTDRIEDALRARQAALVIWNDLGRVLAQGENRRWISRLSWFLGQNQVAREEAVAAIELLEQFPEHPELAMAYSNLAQLCMLEGDAEPAVLWGTRAIELARRLGDVEILAHALNNVGAARRNQDPEASRDQMQESLALSLEHDLHEHAARAYTNLSSVAVQSKDYARAEPFLDAGIDYTRRLDLDSWTLYMMGWRARLHLERGRWAEAAEDAARVIAHPRVSAVSRISALAALACVRVRRGDPGADGPLEEAGRLAAMTGEYQRIAPVTAVRAELMGLRSELSQVEEELRVAFDLAREKEEPWGVGEFGFWLWRLGSLAELPVGAAEPYVLLTTGRCRAAAQAFERAGCPYEAAVALSCSEDSQDLLDSLQRLDGLGAAPAAKAVRHELRRRGVRRVPRGLRPSTRGNPARLTGRQMEVLGLLADGLSNAAIARRLFVSPKTVDHHVSAVLQKLSAHTRGEAVAKARDEGILASE